MFPPPLNFSQTFLLTFPPSWICLSSLSPKKRTHKNTKIKIRQTINFKVNQNSPETHTQNTKKKKIKNNLPPSKKN